MPCQCKTDKQRAKCVNWIGPESGLIEKNDVTGELRASTGCFPDVMLRFMAHVVKTNTSAAAAVESNRNEVALGLARISQTIRERSKNEHIAAECANEHHRLAGPHKED